MRKAYAEQIKMAASWQINRELDYATSLFFTILDFVQELEFIAQSYLNPHTAMQ